MPGSAIHAADAADRCPAHQRLHPEGRCALPELPGHLPRADLPRLRVVRHHRATRSRPATASPKPRSSAAPAAPPGLWPASSDWQRQAMTGQPGVIYMLHFDRPYQHAQHYVGWTDDLLDRLDQHASGPRRPAGRRHLASRYRLHPGPHLRRHPPHRTRHQERRAARSATARPAPASPRNGRWAAPARRLHPPHLPQPRRKAVTPMSSTTSAPAAATSGTTPTSSTSWP